MFASRIVKIVQKVPRSHIIVLKSIYICYKRKEKGDGLGVSSDALLSIINENFARKLGLDKFMINEVYDILKSLESADILQINEGYGKKKSAISSLML